MAKAPSPDDKNQTTDSPTPEELKPQADDVAEKSEGGSVPAALASAPKAGKRRARRGTYRPSHKATFFGLAAVVAILAINAAVIAFVLRGQSKPKNSANESQVTINQSALDKLGVNSTPVGDSGIQLTVGPNAKFNGNVQIAGDANIGGQLQLNGKFSASSASFAQLQAGQTSLNGLDVNGDGTFTNVNIRSGLVVAGATRLEGLVTDSQLLTVNNSENVSGNLAVGGLLSAANAHVGSLVSDGTLTIGGHIITGGEAPGISAGSCGGASISGNDEAGTIFVSGNCSGPITIAHLTFRAAYSGYPHVGVTPICSGVSVYLVSPGSSGFSIGVNGSLSGGCQFNYIVEQ